MSLSVKARNELRAPFTALQAELLAAAKGRRVVLMQNHGNYGDALIHYGTRRFLEDLNLEFTEYDMSSRRKIWLCALHGAWDRLIDKYLFVYAGSGAWALSYNLAYVNVQRQRRFTKNIFVLPTTFEEYKMNLDFPVYARDLFQSKSFIRDKPFCHDMAFYLALISPDRVLPNRTPPSKKAGVMLRTDKESSGYKPLEFSHNIDLSTMGSHKDNPRDFLRAIDDYEEIVTDRLHIAIGAALLGKEVTMLAGSYFKIKAIYNSSMAGIFDKITFVENIPKAFIREYVLMTLEGNNENLVDDMREELVRRHSV